MGNHEVMRAAQVIRLDGPESLQIVDVERPVPGPDEVLIHVRAAGVGFPEVLMSRGLYQRRPELPFTPGAEVAGEVAETSSEHGLAVGDRVAAVCFLGGYAEYAVAKIVNTMRLPDNVSFEQGAAFIFNYATAHFALLQRGRLAPGEDVLVHGAAGGVGTAAIQVAKAFGAHRVIAVTSTDEKGHVALGAGSDEYVLADGFKDAVKGADGSGAVDVVVDPVGGDRFTDSLRCLRPDGRLIVLGFAAGEIPTVRVNRLLLGNIDVVGAAWVGYTLARPRHLDGQLSTLVPYLARGELRPVVGSVHALDQAAAALLELDRNQARGKVVIVPTASGHGLIGVSDTAG